MTVATHEVPKRRPNITGAISLWAVSLAFLLLGPVFAFAGARDGWDNDLVAGLLTTGGSVLLLPPILSRMRGKWEILGPTWVPVLFAVALLFFSWLVATPFAPDAATQNVLRRAAITRARDLITTGQFSEARFAVGRYAGPGDLDGQVSSIIRDADAQEKMKQTREKVPQSPTFTPKPAQAIFKTSPSAGTAPDPAADYAERVKTYWLPEAFRLPTSAPTGGEGYGALLSQLETLRSYYAEGEALTLNTKQKAVHRQFKVVLAARQSRLYPSFREAFALAMRAGLFRNDVDVVAVGPSTATLRFTGTTFASNANIEDMQQNMTSALENLRFRRVEYRWSKYFREGYHYDLKPKADSDVSGN